MSVKNRWPVILGLGLLLSICIIAIAFLWYQTNKDSLPAFLKPRPFAQQSIQFGYSYDQLTNRETLSGVIAQDFNSEENTLRVAHQPSQFYNSALAPHYPLGQNGYKTLIFVEETPNQNNQQWRFLEKEELEQVLKKGTTTTVTISTISNDNRESSLPFISHIHIHKYLE